MPSSTSWINNIPQATFNIASDAAKGAKEKMLSGAGTIVEKVGDMAPHRFQGIVNPAAGALGAYLKYKSITPEQHAIRQLFGDIDPKELGNIIDRLESAKRLKLSHFTPAEAIVNAFESAKQGSFGKTREGAKLLDELGRQRIGSEKTSFLNFLDEIHNPNVASPLKDAAYETAMQSTVPPDFISRHANRHTVKDAIKKIENDSAYRQLLEEDMGIPLSDVKPNTFGYWNLVKQALYEIEDAKKSKHGEPTTSSNVVKDTRRQIVSEMDAINPDYAKARRISELGHVRKGLERHFNNREITGNEIYKYLKNNRNREELLEKLHDLPELQQTVNDWYKIGKDLIPETLTNRSAAALEKTSMNKQRNELDAMKQKLDQQYGEAHDVATVKLMTDPNWDNVLIEYLKRKKK